MAAPYEYTGRGDTCMGCVDIIRRGEMVGAVSGRPDQLLCVACWWSQECGLELPAWARGTRWPGSAPAD